MTTRVGSAQMEPFLDWYGIWAGNVGYGEDGCAWATDTPTGVGLSVQKPEISEPVLTADRAWEKPGLSVASRVLREAGKFRMWYHVAPEEPSQPGIACYAESDDGYEWSKPRVGLHEFNGTMDNNIVSESELGSVFVDPTGGSDERYKALVRRSHVIYRGTKVEGDDWVTLKQELLAKGLREGEIMQKEVVMAGTIYGFVSPDGIRWRQLQEPLAEQVIEAPWDANYDADSGTYVAHFVPAYGGRRSLSRSETRDFRCWPSPRHILRPDGQFSPCDDFYNSAYTPYPGAGYLLDFYAYQNSGRYHLMFPSVFHRDRNVVQPYLAVSRDGLNWVWPELRPIIPLEKQGAEEEGQIYATPDLLPFADEKWGLLFTTGRTNHHETLYHKPDRWDPGEYRLAFWTRDRLVALEAIVEGSATLVPRVCRGERLLLNCKTGANGWIKAELIEPSLFPPIRVTALEGYSFLECEPARGDSLGTEVRWNGSPDLSKLRGRHVCVRLRMFKAKLFALSI